MAATEKQSRRAPVKAAKKTATQKVPASPAKPTRGMAGLRESLEARSNSLAERSREESPLRLLVAPEPDTTDGGGEQPAEAVGEQPPQAPVDEPADPQPVEVSTAVAAAADQTPEPPSRKLAPTGLPRPVPGVEGRLERSGEKVIKHSMEVAPQLLRALAVWERDETKAQGQRVFRERLVDIAMDLLPTDIDGLLKLVSQLPPELRGDGEMLSCRVRASVREKLTGFGPELRVAGVKDVRMRDIYSAGLYSYLRALGVDVSVAAR